MLRDEVAARMSPPGTMLTCWQQEGGLSISRSGPYCAGTPLWVGNMGPDRLDCVNVPLPNADHSPGANGDFLWSLGRV